jgi:Fuc2NAc and GlcNAc transferase
MPLIAVAVSSVVLAGSGALLMAKRGIAWGFADIPNERSSHASIVPRGGGFGIPLAVALASLLFAPSQPLVVGASIFISTIAFFNDKRESPVIVRLGFEALAAFALAWPVFLAARALRGQSLALLILLMSVLYIVAQANIFNFMDGINGIAGIEALISFTLLGIYAQRMGQSDLCLICIAVAAGAFGFLPWNFPCARVFMGDVGSLFLGFLFAAMIIMMSGSLKEFLGLALFQGVFSIDGVMTIIRRALKKQNVFRAHKQHLYQLLVHTRGWSHAQATIIYGIAQACFGVASLLLFSAPIGTMAVLWSLLLMSYLVGHYLASRMENGQRSPREV